MVLKDKKTKITFHNGILTIGGTIIEVVYEDSHIFFDFGSEYNPSASFQPSNLQELLDEKLVPYLNNMYDPSIELKGYKSSEDNFKHTAVFLSHMHLDHSKIINYLNPSIPLYTLEGTKSLLNTLNINDDFLFPLHNKKDSNTREIIGVKENEVIEVGKIKVKVMPVDHDAYGACGLLIKTPDLVISYTGDIRLHGYRKEDTLKFCKESENCDVLLIEGVTVSFKDFEDEENEGTEEENTEEEEDAGYKPSIFFDFDTGDFVTLHDGKLKEASGFEAWVQWCYKTIMTQRYAHEGYSTDIGIDYESALQADSREEAESILQREIEEALMADPSERTLYVGNIMFQWEAEHCLVTVQVQGIDGDIEIQTQFESEVV